MADTNLAVIDHSTKDVRAENVSEAWFVLEDGPGVHHAPSAASCRTRSCIEAFAVSDARQNL